MVDDVEDIRTFNQRWDTWVSMVISSLKIGRKLITCGHKLGVRRILPMVGCKVIIVVVTTQRRQKQVSSIHRKFSSRKIGR